jgi:hypothetical protein
MALYSDGRYVKSEQLFERLIETEITVLGEEHPDTLASMNILASTYNN